MIVTAIGGGVSGPVNPAGRGRRQQQKEHAADGGLQQRDGRHQDQPVVKLSVPRLRHCQGEHARKERSSRERHDGKAPALLAEPGGVELPDAVDRHADADEQHRRGESDAQHPERAMSRETAGRGERRLLDQQQQPAIKDGRMQVSERMDVEGSTQHRDPVGGRESHERYDQAGRGHPHVEPVARRGHRDHSLRHRCCRHAHLRPNSFIAGCWFGG